MITTETHQFTIGRNSGCDVQISHPSVGAAHLKVYFSKDSVLIEDLGSSSGTFVLHEGKYKRVKSAKVKLDTKLRLGVDLDSFQVKEIIDDYLTLKEKNRKDLAKKFKRASLKRCFECGSVLLEEKIYCECCGAIFDEAC